MTAHLCHARRCTVPVPPRLLMCRAHWAQVPPDLQRRLWAAYRPGQERTKSPSREYVAAARACINAVPLPAQAALPLTGGAR